MRNSSSKALLLIAIVVTFALAACAAPAPAPTAPAPTAAPAQETKPTEAPAPEASHPSTRWGCQSPDRRCGSLRPEHEEGHRTGPRRDQRGRRHRWCTGGSYLRDDRLNAADAQTAFLKLVQSDKVPAVMGSGSSSISLSLCPKAQELKTVQISSISTAPSLKDCGKYFFSPWLPTRPRARMGQGCDYLGVKEAAVVYINMTMGSA